MTIWVDFNAIEHISYCQSCELTEEEYEQFLQLSDKAKELFLFEKQEDWYERDWVPASYEIDRLENMEVVIEDDD